MFALVDANAFYCSAEQVFRPDLRGKPLVVLSNNDGCIVAANRQAKELGIPKFAPFFKVRELCEKQGVIALSSNYELYADLSAKMMAVIGRFAPVQHIYSIDESFLSLRHCHQAIPCLLTHGALIRRAVWKECRLPVCVGMGETLTLAKLANHAAKKIEGYQGVCILNNETARQQVLKSVDVSEVWGIGRRLSAKLKVMKVHTAWDLSRLEPAVAQRQFNVEVERIVYLHSLQQALSKHTAIAAYKARQQHSLCKVLMCFAASSPYDVKPVSHKMVHSFAYPTSDTTVLTHTVMAMAKAMFQQGERYYKIGVGLLDLVEGKHAQIDFLNPKPDDPRLMAVFDGLNQRYGTDSVFLAAQGIEHKWAMRRERLSPQYTTKWGDLPVVRC
ncbi:Y-family DNA polymerase [Vibrio algicola]|uniref:DUF4113 domain-containing protein n=1 Tax=Vibrio algicola TaxID=2662262 RepID=A0A5Q0TC39_9VIBR|nr:Y-family DNA polymerase [Vibrio algicola]